MNVFISWSGTKSHDVAVALREWLPSVLQALKPWLSDQDINKGRRWSVDIFNKLEDTSACILCLTPDSIGSEWMHFEAGVVLKEVDESLICPYLVGLKKSDLSGPLSHFQASDSTKDETLRLLASLNEALGSSALDVNRLLTTFEKFWPELERKLEDIENCIPETDVLRPQNEVIEDILQTVRRIEGANTRIEASSVAISDEDLSSMERDVAKFIFEGIKVNEISKILNVSPKTVNSIRYHLFSKLHVSSDVELVFYLMRQNSESKK